MLDMLSDQDEHIIQQLHIISLLLSRSRKQVDSNRVMSKKYSEQAGKLIGELMEYIEPTGRTR